MTDILKQIEADARRLRVARKLPQDDQPIPVDLVLLVQEDFERFLKVTGLSLHDVSRKMGKGYSGPTLSMWRNWDGKGDYKGNVDKITRAVNQWMETYAQQATAPKPSDFVQTVVARRMLNVINETIKQRAIGLITSDSGRGKTITLKAAEATYPGAIYLRVKSSTRSPNGFARMLGRVLQLRNAKTTLDIQLKIIETLSGTGRVLMVDEAHQLTHNALEFIRDIHDECEIPIIIAGTRKLDDTTSDHDIFFGQFASRIAVRYDVNEHVRDGGGDPKKALHTVDDVKKLFASDKIRLTSDGIAALTRLANIEGFGGLRLCVQVVRVAVTVADHKNIKIDAKLIFQVLREMHGKTRAVRQIETAAEKVKVAC